MDIVIKRERGEVHVCPDFPCSHVVELISSRFDAIFSAYRSEIKKPSWLRGPNRWNENREESIKKKVFSKLRDASFFLPFSGSLFNIVYHHLNELEEVDSVNKIVPVLGASESFYTVGSYKDLDEALYQTAKHIAVLIAVDTNEVFRNRIGVLLYQQ